MGKKVWGKGAPLPDSLCLLVLVTGLVVEGDREWGDAVELHDGGLECGWDFKFAHCVLSPAVQDFAESFFSVQANRKNFVPGAFGHVQCSADDMDGVAGGHALPEPILGLVQLFFKAVCKSFLEYAGVDFGDGVEKRDGSEVRETARVSFFEDEHYSGLERCGIDLLALVPIVEEVLEHLQRVVVESFENFCFYLVWPCCFVSF